MKNNVPLVEKLIAVATLLSNTFTVEKIRGSLYIHYKYSVLTLHRVVVVGSLLNHICIFGQVLNSLYI